MEGVLAGQGDVGIVNTYYFGRLLKKNPDLKLALYWPQAAIKLLEWLSSEKAQNLFADANMEYPVNKSVKTHPYVAAWGEFKASEQSLANAGILQKQAIQLMDRADYR
jgi:iron(III) transport system substrate-binding protein